MDLSSLSPTDFLFSLGVVSLDDLFSFFQLVKWTRCIPIRF